MTDKRSNASNAESNHSNDTSGWVLIMDDTGSPSPASSKSSHSRLISPPSFLPSNSRTTNVTNSPSPPGRRLPTRRPNSRQATGSNALTTAASPSRSNSVPAIKSRPTTPTFLPVPVASSSTGMASSIIGQQKRSSLGASTASPLQSQAGGIPRSRPNSALSGVSGRPLSKPLPLAPHATSRSRPNNLSATTPNVLAQSRIGRPVTTGRKSGDFESDSGNRVRIRAGSTTLL